ncbi:MAG: VWA domain-containing protein [Rhodobacterales bacterium]|nr:VWA domain-containing protein [Rhodobacterales bacterium]
MSVMPNPLPTQSTPNTGCQLVAADGRELALSHVHLEATAGQGLACTIVRQTFHNPWSEPLQLHYLLPLPADGAVIDFAFTIGERRITGKVAEKQSARQQFEQAILEGRTAALLEQDRPNLFTQELGNVPPGVSIPAEITIEHPLNWSVDSWQYRFPTVVAPRFHGNRTPDASRISVDVLDGPAPARATLQLTLQETPTAPPCSSTHAIDVQDSTVSLGAGVALDRDIAVSWKVGSAQPGTSIRVCRPSEDATAYAQLTLIPAQPDFQVAVARDLILLLDTSGSMGGRPLQQLKDLCRAMIQSLTDRDRLEMISFSSRTSPWKSGPVSMSAANRAAALSWLESQQAGGGTHMHTAILEAITPLRSDAQRQVVLVSDGLIGFEHEIIGTVLNKLPSGSRVHAVGVGSGVNRGLMTPLARAGAGVEVVLGLDESVDKAKQTLLRRTTAPLITELQVSGAALVGQGLRSVDVYAGSPSRLSLAVQASGGTLTLTGRTATGPWQTTVNVPPTAPGEGRRGIATRWARDAVADLELQRAAGQSEGVDAAITALGLQHRIATRLTSWLAVSDEVTVDPGAPIRKVDVPQALPYGMSAQGVGLRTTSSPQPKAMRLRMASRSAMAPPAPPMPALRAGSAAPSRLDAAKQSKKSKRLVEKVMDVMGGFFPGPEPAAEYPASAPMEESAEFDAFEREEEEAADHDVFLDAPDEGGAVIHARIRLRKDGTLVLEWVLDQDVDWDPADLKLIDGTTLSVAKGTTRAGALTAGQTVRITLRWDDARPLPALQWRGTPVEIA